MALICLEGITSGTISLIAEAAPAAERLEFNGTLCAEPGLSGSQTALPRTLVIDELPKGLGGSG